MSKSKKILNVIIFMVTLAIISITICFKLFGTNIPEDFVPFFFLGQVVVYGIVFVVTFAMILLIVREDKKIILNKEDENRKNYE